jgi:serine protease Do
MSAFRGCVRQVVFLIAVALALFAHAGAEPDLLSKIEAAVFKVAATNGDGSTTVGSAVMVTAGKFVTNCHVIRRAAKIHLESGLGQWAARVQARDIEHDVCLLSADDSADDAVKVTACTIGSTKDLQVGQVVYAVGYSGGVRLTVSEGQIRGLYNYDGASVVRTSAGFSPGASGGGLFDAGGRLIGILTFRATVRGDYFYAVPSEWLGFVTGPAAMRPARTSTAFWERMANQRPYFMQGVEK